MVLVPASEDPGDIAAALDGFDRSGTMGTVVEMISSPDTLRRAGEPDVDLTVRAVPDTRVIQLHVRGDREAVRPALEEVMRSSGSRLGELRDLWQLRVLASAGSASPAPPGTPLLLVATLALAVLGAIATWVLLTRSILGTAWTSGAPGGKVHQAPIPFDGDGDGLPTRPRHRPGQPVISE